MTEQDVAQQEPTAEDAHEWREPPADAAPAEREQEHEHPDDAHDHRIGLRALVAGAVAAAVIVLLALPAFSTVHPGYYRRYRDLRPRMDAWRTSTHARMNCISCHVEPGTRGMASFGTRSIPAFYSQLLVGPKKTNLLHVPSREACQKCHTAYRQVSPSGDLLIPHKAHVEVLKVNCTVCHKDLVHSANAHGLNRPEMGTCLKLCHDGVKATEKCVKCHTRKATPATHARKDWLGVHGRMSETMDCGKCHEWTPDYCGDCHKKRPSTHFGNWKKNHQVRARANGKGCLVCHGLAKFCKDCH